MEKQVKNHRQIIVMELEFGLLGGFIAGVSYWHLYGYPAVATVEKAIEAPVSTV